MTMKRMAISKVPRCVRGGVFLAFVALGVNGVNTTSFASEMEKENNAPFITYLYSSTTQPVITCHMLHVCDIALQPGEVITGMTLGDSARWLVSQLVSGEGNQKRWHVLIKPIAATIGTNAIITTSKRTYYLALESSDSNADYSRQIQFDYPAPLKNKGMRPRSHHRTRPRKFTRTEALPLMATPEIIDANYRIRVKKPFFGKAPAWYPCELTIPEVPRYLLICRLRYRLSMPLSFMCWIHKAKKCW